MTYKEIMSSLIKEYGKHIANSPKQFEGLLRDYLHEHPLEKNISIHMLHTGIMSSLLNQKKLNQLEIDNFIEKIHAQFGTDVLLAKELIFGWKEIFLDNDLLGIEPIFLSERIYRVIENNYIPGCIAVSSKYIVAGGSAINLWDIKSGDHLKTINCNDCLMHSIAISTNSKFIVAVGKSITLWGTESGKLIRTFQCDNCLEESVVISYDNKFIVSGGLDKTIKLWNLKSGKLIRTFKGHNNQILSVTVSNDNKFIVSGGLDKTIKLWNLKSGKLIRTFEGHIDIILSVTVSNDNRFIASGGWDKSIKLWNLHSGKLIRTFEGHSNDISSIIISADNNYIISSSGDGTAKVWSLSTGKAINTFVHDTRVATCYENGEYIGISKKVVTLNSLKKEPKSFLALLSMSSDNTYMVLANANSYFLWKNNIKSIDTVSHNIPNWFGILLNSFSSSWNMKE